MWEVQQPPYQQEAEAKSFFVGGCKQRAEYVVHLNVLSSAASSRKAATAAARDVEASV